MADDSQAAPQQDLGTTFRALPPERQKALLGKMNPQQKQNLYTALQKPKAAAAAPKEDESYFFGAEKKLGAAKEEAIAHNKPVKAYASAFGEGVLKDTGKLIDFAHTPLGLGTIAAGATSPLISRLLGIGFGAKMLKDSPSFKDVGKEMSYAFGVEDIDKLFGIDDLKLDKPEKAGPEGMQNALMGSSLLAGTAGETMGSKEVVRGLRGYADKAMTRKLELKKGQTEGQPALEGVRVHGTVKTYQDIIDKVNPEIDNHMNAAKTIIAKADTSGVKIKGLDKAISAIYDPAIKLARKQGDITGPAGVNVLKDEKIRASSEVVQDPVTGKEVLKKLDFDKPTFPSVADTKRSAVQKRGFKASESSTLGTLNRQLGHVMSDIISKQVPGLGQHYEVGSKLMTVRDAAEEKQALAGAGLADKVKGIFRGGGAGLVGYVVSGAAGAPFYARYAGALGLAWLWDRLPTVSMRAAAAVRLGDWLDAMQKGAAPPPMRRYTKPGPKPSGPPSGAPQAGPASPLPGAAPASPAVGPTAPPAAASASPGAPSAGAGPFPASPAPAAPAAPAPPSPEQATVAAATAKALGQPVPGGVTKVPEGQSGIPEGLRKYADYLSELLVRKEAPKSGADKVAIDKQIESLKKILDPKIDPVERTKLVDKVDAAMRKQKSRAVAAEKAPVAGTPTAVGKTDISQTGSKSFEPISPAPDPEQMAIQNEEARQKLPELYKSIKELPGSKDVLPLLMKQAKDAKLSSIEIYNGALEVYNFLKEHGKDLP